jgi:hypothetical protein
MVDDASEVEWCTVAGGVLGESKAAVKEAGSM